MALIRHLRELPAELRPSLPIGVPIFPHWRSVRAIILPGTALLLGDEIYLAISYFFSTVEIASTIFWRPSITSREADKDKYSGESQYAKSISHG